MSENIELGAFSLDIREVVRQLKQDLKEDWYPDSLGYEDALNPDVAAELLTECFEKNHGLFVPDDRTELNIPKKGFVLRYSLEMSLTDRLYYQALIGELIPFFDPLLPNQVLNHRYAEIGHRAKRYLFKHPIEQWELFKGYVAQESRDKPVILVTDIQNYYENIQVNRTISVLEENIQNIKAEAAEKAKLRRVIGELHRCLGKWCYTPTHGLPQNRDASSFLANLVMLPVDEAMLQHKYAYYRYMDDVRVAVKTRYEARGALQHLTTELRRLGLSLNSAKTEILEPGMQGYQEALGKDDPVLAQIDSMWQSRSLPVIRRSFAPLQKLAQDLISNGATQERGFRFSIQRFQNLALCPELDVPKSFFDPMIEVCVDQLDTQPFSSDQIVRFLKATPTSQKQLTKVAELVADLARAIYDWQNYLIWQLLVYKKYTNPRLLEIAQKRATQVDRPADRAGAILYWGALGKEADRLHIARQFQTYDKHIVQRNALIAVHEIGFDSGIKEHVASYIIPSLKGTYRRLRDKFHGQYFHSLPTISASFIYDEMSAYD